jgi:Protein of unknown function (DUF1360)
MATAAKQPPHAAYATITGVFAGGLGVAGTLARAFGRNPACQTPLDLVVLSAATFKGARTLARDEVTSFLRDPFVRGRAHTGEDEAPTDPRAALRPPADVVIWGGGDQRLLAGRVRRTHRTGGLARTRRRQSALGDADELGKSPAGDAVVGPDGSVVSRGNDRPAVLSEQCRA